MTTLPDLPPSLQTHEGGGVRVTGTRVSLDSLVALYDEGMVPEQAVYSFPTVSLAAVTSAFAYIERERDAVDEYLRRREAKAEELRREIEAHPSEARERLRALKALQTL